MRGAIGAHKSWAKTENRTERTANGRKAFNDRFETLVDPDGVLPPAERARRAESERRAYFLQLALKSAKSRRRAKEARAHADQLDREADQADEALGGSPPGLTAPGNPLAGTTNAEDLSKVINAAHRALADSGVQMSPSKVSRLVRRFEQRARENGATFHEFLTDAANLTSAQHQRLLGNPDLARVIAYFDPTGETAVRNVQRAGGSNR